MNADPRTVQTYDDAAAQMAAHFQQYKDGVANEEIAPALALVKQPATARVIEIGCGAGKDAAEITKHVGWYEGFDPSAKLLEIARTHVPGASFVQADALSYTYPNDLDAVFAFASLLHLNKNDFATACQKIATALKPGGVFCMTLKEAPEYTEQLQEDDFGVRQFYLYSPALVRELVGGSFKLAHESHTTAGPKAKPWMSLIFVKE